MDDVAYLDATVPQPVRPSDVVVVPAMIRPERIPFLLGHRGRTVLLIQQHHTLSQRREIDWSLFAEFPCLTVSEFSRGVQGAAFGEST